MKAKIWEDYNFYKWYHRKKLHPVVTDSSLVYSVEGFIICNKKKSMQIENLVITL